MTAILQVIYWLGIVITSVLFNTTDTAVVGDFPIAGLPRLTKIKADWQATDTLKADAETGLALDDKLMLVKAHCTSCHSPKLIIQNRFTRDGWKEKIRWMQRTQKLWDLGESEPAVLDYLAKHYGPEAKAFDGRRMPLKNVKWYPLDK